MKRKKRAVEKRARGAVRTLGLYHYNAGLSQKEVSQITGATTRTVNDWVKKWRASDISTKEKIVVLRDQIRILTDDYLFDASEAQKILTEILTYESKIFLKDPNRKR